jgi:hypothetical protein
MISDRTSDHFGKSIGEHSGFKQYHYQDLLTKNYEIPCLGDPQFQAFWTSFSHCLMVPPYDSNKTTILPISSVPSSNASAWPMLWHRVVALVVAGVELTSSENTRLSQMITSPSTEIRLAWRPPGTKVNSDHHSK